MRVSLVDVDGHNFPNLALMKISAWHKKMGYTVDWYEPLFSHPDIIYASKVFTFTPDYVDYNVNDPEPIKGGTGYRKYTNLPDEIDRMLPDYSIYPQFDFAIGFLSRGCIRNCPWCVVPRKEGTIRQYDDIERVAQDRKHVVLMDNNFLANDPEFIKEQLDKATRLKLRIDFNQGLDARLVTPENAHWLAKTKWKRYVRFACDTPQMVPHLRSAVLMLREAGYNGEIFCYVLAKELNESYDRIRRILAIDSKIIPYCMPFRDLNRDGAIIDHQLERLARWCNRPWLRQSIKFEEYKRK